MGSGPWGPRWQRDQSARGGVTVTNWDARTLACDQCGAVLAFSPGAQELECRYCGHRNLVIDRPIEISENDLEHALSSLEGEALDDSPIDGKCTRCGASFQFPAHYHAGMCPFCGTPAVAAPDLRRKLAPGAVLPFVIAEPDARKLIQEWLHGLWFAPSALAHEARGKGFLHGTYIPHWTFDAGTRSRYSGRRGDVYYETRWVETVVDGRRVRRAVQVPKIRWTAARGEVARDFDDVLVVAGKDRPTYLVERLEPWDLQGLKPYGSPYLSGFDSELYREPVEVGSAKAKEMMRGVIESDVRASIGGDQQIIDKLSIDWGPQTYKLVLLPVWIASFTFIGKAYQVVVNGRTGEVHGERPYSIWKILGASIVGFLILILLVGMFQMANDWQLPQSWPQHW